MTYLLLVEEYIESFISFWVYTRVYGVNVIWRCQLTFQKNSISNLLRYS